MSESAADLVGLASRLAEAARDRSGKRRKLTGESYIVLPRAVAKIVESVPHAPEMVAAAWLHDILEDTDLTRGDLEALCGAEVARLVVAVSKPVDSRGISRDDFYTRIALKGPRAATIKLADIVDNAGTAAGCIPSEAWYAWRESVPRLIGLRSATPVFTGAP